MEMSAKAFILDCQEISSRLKLVLLYHTAANLYLKQGWTGLVSNPIWWLHDKGILLTSYWFKNNFLINNNNYYQRKHL